MIIFIPNINNTSPTFKNEYLTLRDWLDVAMANDADNRTPSDKFATAMSGAYSDLPNIDKFLQNEENADLASMITKYYDENGQPRTDITDIELLALRDFLDSKITSSACTV